MMRRSAFRSILGLCALVASGSVFAAPPPAIPAPAAQPPAEAVLPAKPTGPQPKLVFDSVLVNIGDVVHGQDAVATFAYRNTGDAPLHILSAKPG